MEVRLLNTTLPRLNTCAQRRRCCCRGCCCIPNVIETNSRREEWDQVRHGIINRAAIVQSVAVDVAVGSLKYEESIRMNDECL